jgi:regulator of protease activity HflC (stomatin/prohibitin superfamily)
MKTLIPEGHIGLLYEDGALKRLLPPGKHDFSDFFAPTRAVTVLDTRERSATIKNQEILTADKVSVRVSLLVYFKVIDPKAAVTVVAAYEDRIYEDVQLAARRFLATQTLDQILKDRNELSNAIKTDVSGSARVYGVEVLRADVKDLVFPGNLREVMNKVIETERQSEALLINARTQVEVATLHAKSQAAALEDKIKADEKRVKLLSENPMLLKLKELEVLEAIGNKGNNHFYVGVDKLSRGP